jgi:endonuclease/exonuclease/phosphatase family metal-dependent hydrolase
MTTNKIVKPSAHPIAGRELRVLSLNCWGVPGARDREARMEAIGTEIARMGLDLVGLQEIYYQRDRLRVLELAAEGGLIYHHYYPSGVFGSGLMVISRFPLLETQFWPYSLNGRPQDFIRPDYYAGKGLAFARIETPDGPVDFYNTHLIAPYLEIGEDVYFSHRVSQTYELTRIVNEVSYGHPLILAGDFNTTPERLAYRTCIELGQVRDSFKEVNEQEAGVTVTTAIPYLLVHEPERLDFIFFRSGSNQSWQVLCSKVALSEVANDFQEQILAYSDHYGVYSSFRLPGFSPPFEESTEEGIIDEVKTALEEGLFQAEKLSKTSIYLSGLTGLIFTVLAILGPKYDLTRRQFLKLSYRIALLTLFVTTGLLLGAAGFETSEAAKFRNLLGKLEPVGKSD